MKRSKLQLAICLSTSALVVCQVQAAGFQLSEHSASGLGRSFAGEAAIADDASVISRNPAAMSRFERKAISGAISYIDANVSISGTDDAALDADDIIPEAAVPAAYYIHPINDKWAAGLAIYSNFGLSTEFDEDYAAGDVGGTTYMGTMNINPQVSYRLNEALTLGAGLIATHGEAELKRNFGDGIAGLTGGLSSSNLSSLEGTGWGYGWNIGALYELDEDNRFGLAYHSEVDLEFEGDYTSDFFLKAAYDGKTGKLTLNLPDTFEFSGYHRLNPKFAVHYSALWTGWSDLESLEAFVGTTSVFEKEENFSDSWRYALGGTYFLNAAVELRAGIAYDEAASSTSQSISIPDSDRVHYNIGMTYHFDENLSMDFAVNYIDGAETSFDEESAGSAYGIADYSFSSEGTVMVAAVQMNYRF